MNIWQYSGKFLILMEMHVTSIWQFFFWPKTLYDNIKNIYNKIVFLKTFSFKWVYIYHDFLFLLIVAAGDAGVLGTLTTVCSMQLCPSQPATACHRYCEEKGCPGNKTCVGFCSGNLCCCSHQ